MEAIILVGGEGRRLRPLTDTRPKPMMSLVDRPFVAHQLDHLRRFGVRDVIFSCGYRPQALEDHFGDGSALDMRLRYVVDPVPLGTAGAVKNAEGLLQGGRFFVLNGDVLTDLDLAALVEQHERTSATGTIALTPVEDPSAFGLVRHYADRRVEAFVEKPAPEELRPGEPFFINAGTYLLEREMLALIPSDTNVSIERDVFPVMAARGGLFCYPSEAYWRDIGTPASYLEAHLDVLSGAVSTESPRGERYLGPGTRLAAGARVEEHASLGPEVEVGSEALVVASVVGAGTRIGAQATILGAIVGTGVSIGPRCFLGAGVVVGDEVAIAEGLRLPDGEVIPTGARLNGNVDEE